MQQQHLETIHQWKKEELTNKLKDEILKEQKTIKYLKLLKDYFTINNITSYKKFDKRDYNKIIDYFKNKKMIYYNYCDDNFNIHYTTQIRTTYLYIYINNDEIYNARIDLLHYNYNGDLEEQNVLIQIDEKLNYINEKLKQNKKLLKNIDKYIDKFNDKVKDFYKFIYDDTHLNNIVDIYIYKG